MTRKERQPAHAAKMAMKKARRANLRPGFTPMASKRIIARKLPAPKPSKLFVRKPSKNDDPVYRKAVAA